MGTKSFYEYDERAARFYGVDLRTFEARNVVGNDVANVKAPLLVLDSLDDSLRLARVKQGAHDGGPFSLAYRDLVQDNPKVHTFLLDRGNHGGLLYLSDPYWFGITVMSYLKHWQARDEEAVTVRMPALDILAEGTLDGASGDLSLRRQEPRHEVSRPARRVPRYAGRCPAEPLLAGRGGAGPLRV